MWILIVDDDEMNCRGIQSRLEHMNLPQLQRIEVAFSGEEALNYIQHNPVDILLTDIQMVRMNGLDLIAKAKALQPRILSLILTAHASFPYAQQAIELGVESFLLKPCGKEELREAVQKVILKLESTRATSICANADYSNSPVLWAQTYVRNHLREEINMALLANELNLSYSYFSRLFKQETGKSFTAFIAEEKMKEAGKMILAGKKTADVAVDLGYLSAQNLSRAFMNFYQCTPGEYRKKFFGENQ